MNYEKTEVVNYTALGNMNLEDDPAVLVPNTRNIKRKQFSILVSDPETKE